MVKSGAVFIFSVEESGIKRWTEGLAWSQSRISGNFLVGKVLLPRPWDTSDNSTALSGGRGSECSYRPAARGHPNLPTPGTPSGTAAELQAPRACKEGNANVCFQSRRLMLMVSRLSLLRSTGPTTTSFHITPRRTWRPGFCDGQQVIQISWQSKSLRSSRGRQTSGILQTSKKHTRPLPIGERFAQIPT